MENNASFPLITLGIPIYNAADLLERTLLSALNQTYPNIEYIFVDDKGNSMDVVHRVLKEHPRKLAVRIIDQGRNQGVAVSRNAILDHATGEYLFTMDCDDVIVPDCIETLYRSMVAKPVDFVAASFVRVDMDGNEYPGCSYADVTVEGGEHAVARYRYGQGKDLFVAAWNKLYRVGFLRKHAIRCQPGHFNEDPWFTYQVIINARSCTLLSACTLRYTCNPASVSGIAGSQGYSPIIANQYVEIEQLKRSYIPALRGEDFYRGLLVDIMFMSIYLAYQIDSSPRVPKQQKRENMNALLTKAFASPEGGGGEGRTLKYCLLRVFFALPIGIKRSVVGLLSSLQLKKVLKRWMRLK